MIQVNDFFSGLFELTSTFKAASLVSILLDLKYILAQLRNL